MDSSITQANVEEYFSKFAYSNEIEEELPKTPETGLTEEQVQISIQQLLREKAELEREIEATKKLKLEQLSNNSKNDSYQTKTILQSLTNAYYGILQSKLHNHFLLQNSNKSDKIKTRTNIDNFLESMLEIFEKMAEKNFGQDVLKKVTEASTIKRKNEENRQKKRRNTKLSHYFEDNEERIVKKQKTNN